MKIIVPALCVMLTSGLTACASTRTDSPAPASGNQAAAVQKSSNAEGAGGEALKTPVGVGDEAPDFTLAGHKGAEVKLSDARGKSPVVLVFYRGHW